MEGLPKEADSQLTCDGEMLSRQASGMGGGASPPSAGNGSMSLLWLKRALQERGGTACWEEGQKPIIKHLLSRRTTGDLELGRSLPELNTLGATGRMEGNKPNLETGRPFKDITTTVMENEERMCTLQLEMPGPDCLLSSVFQI